MRNISQIILNIDIMKELMKELKNLEAIRELLASHPIYTYDYSDGLLINKEDTNRYLILGILDEAGYPHCCLLGQPKQVFNPQLN